MGLARLCRWFLESRFARSFPFGFSCFFFCFFEHTIDIPDGIMIRACIMHLAGAAVIVSWAYSTQRRVSFNGEKPGGQWGSSSHFLRCGDIRHCGLKREGHLNNRNKNKNKKNKTKTRLTIINQKKKNSSWKGYGNKRKSEATVATCNHHHIL